MDLAILETVFRTAGVMFSLADCGLVMGYSTSLLPQLRAPDSTIILDDASVSWIGSIIVLAFIPSNFVVPIIMGKYGRKVSNIVGVVPNIIGWIVISTASSVTSLIIAGLLQGFSLGMITLLAPVLVGEYTTPKNRGVFLTTNALATSAGMLCVQAVGLYVHWQLTAIGCACFALVDLVIVICSPESPSWLIDQGRYEESKKVFRWLRGDDEEEELTKMIKAHMERKALSANLSQHPSLTKKIKTTLNYCLKTMKKKEFYKPIIIMIHLIAIFHWCGSHFLIIFAVEVVNFIMGCDTYTSIIIISAGFQRPISTLFAMYAVSKVKRRTLLFTTIGLNIFAILATAGYTYTRTHNMFPFDHPSIGISLIHLHIFSISIGAMNMPLIIAGELFPLEYRTLSSSICVITGVPQCMIPVAVFPFLVKSIGLYGIYCIHATVMAYCLAVTGILLPETKDRTLQDIEDEFRGRRTERPLTCEELKCLRPLTS